LTDHDFPEQQKMSRKKKGLQGMMHMVSAVLDIGPDTEQIDVHSGHTCAPVRALSFNNCDSSDSIM
jgi:hypothetical protein